MKGQAPKPVPNFVMLASQVDGYCQALLASMQMKELVGDPSKELLRTLLKEAKRCFEGKAFENLPNVSIGDSAPRVLYESGGHRRRRLM